MTIDAGPAGVLEASDLVHRNVATRVALFDEMPDGVDAEFIRRGFKYESRTAVWRRMLLNLGVATIEAIPSPVNGTAAEGERLPGWCATHGIGSVLVVTTADHSRRIRRVLRRAMADSGVQVNVRPARFSSFKPDTWWRSRNGIRIGVVELEKLLLDVLRHPLS